MKNLLSDSESKLDEAGKTFLRAEKELNEAVSHKPILKREELKVLLNQTNTKISSTLSEIDNINRQLAEVAKPRKF